MNNNDEFKTRFAESQQRAFQDKQKLRHVVDLLGASSPRHQLELLRGVLENPKDAELFLRYPEVYAAERGVVVDPELVRSMVDTVVFGEPMGERLVEVLGPDVTASLLEMRGDGRIAAIPVAVATAVAVASAAVALVAQAGTRLDAGMIKGLPLQGIQRGIAAANTVVAVYGAATATAALVASSDIGKFASLYSQPRFPREQIREEGL